MEDLSDPFNGDFFLNASEINNIYFVNSNIIKSIPTSEKTKLNITLNKVKVKDKQTGRIFLRVVLTKASALYFPGIHIIIPLPKWKENRWSIAENQGEADILITNSYPGVLNHLSSLVYYANSAFANLNFYEFVKDLNISRDDIYFYYLCGRATPNFRDTGASLTWCLPLTVEKIL